MSKVKRDPHNIRRNISLNDKYLSNDGGNEGILIDDDGIVTVSSALSIKESSSAVNHLDTYGRLWVNNTDPTALYFTNDDGDDIQLTSGDSAIGTISLAADRISVGDAQVNIATSSGDIVFKGNDSSGTEEYLRLNTDKSTDGNVVTPVTEIMSPSNNRFRIRTQGIQHDLQLMSQKSVQISHFIADTDYDTQGTAITLWKKPASFTDATCDYNDDPTISHDDDNGKIHVDMFVSGNGIPEDSYITSITNDTTFELNASTTGGNLTNQTLNFSEGDFIVPTVFLGTLNAVWEVDQSFEEIAQVLDQDHTDIPAQQRGSTSGSRCMIKVKTDGNGIPRVVQSPSSSGDGYTPVIEDATCDYNHTTGLNADGSGGDADTIDRSTIIHDDDSGAIKLFMSVTGTGIPIGAYVGEVVSNTCCRIHLGGGTGAVGSGSRVAVTTTATNGTLTFRDRVCFQDPGSTSNYIVLEVDNTEDGLIEFGTSENLTNGNSYRKAYFDMNQSNFHFVADERMKLMSDSMSNNVIQLDADSVFLSGSAHTKKTGRGYTFVHAGDRLFVGNSGCNSVRMRLDGTDANRVFQITATDIPNGNVVTPGADTINSTVWDDAKGCRLVVGKTSGTTELKIDGAVGNFNIDAKGTIVIETETPAADFSSQIQRNIELVPGVGTQTGAVIVDKNITSTTAGTYTGLSIDYDKTGTSTSNNTLHGLLIDADNTTATNGTNKLYGILCTPTLSHASDAGNTSVYGAKFTATGASNGTSIAIGLDVTVTGADTNYAIITSGGNVGLGVADPDTALEVKNTSTQLKLSYDTDSYATIAADSSSNTTITSAESGNIKLDAAGDIILDADGANITLQDGGSTYTPAAASDATTKTYVDSQTVITANAYNNRVDNDSWFLMNNDAAQDLTGTDTTVGNTQDLGTLSMADMKCLMYIVPFNMTVHAVAGSVMDDDNESTTDKRMGIWRLPALAVSGTDPGDTSPDTLTLAYITDGFGTSGIGASRVCAFYDTSADFALIAGDGIFMGYLNPQSAGNDDVTLTMSIWAHQTTP